MSPFSLLSGGVHCRATGPFTRVLPGPAEELLLETEGLEDFELLEATGADDVELLVEVGAADDLALLVDARGAEDFVLLVEVVGADEPTAATEEGVAELTLLEVAPLELSTDAAEEL
jgi:hypothetical protein